MKQLMGVLLLMAPPAWPAELPPGCAWLCGNWVVDPGSSDPAQSILDVALVEYKEPRGAPRREQLREELAPWMIPAEKLVLDQEGKDILIRAEGRPVRRFEARKSHVRVDAQGTARIRTDWKSDALVITESYDRARNHSQTYDLQKDGTLRVTLEVERPGLKRLRIRTVYRRG